MTTNLGHSNYTHSIVSACNYFLPLPTAALITSINDPFTFSLLVVFFDCFLVTFFLFMLLIYGLFFCDFLNLFHLVEKHTSVSGLNFYTHIGYLFNNYPTYNTSIL